MSEKKRANNKAEIRVTLKHKSGATTTQVNLMAVNKTDDTVLRLHLPKHTHFETLPIEAWMNIACFYPNLHAICNARGQIIVLLQTLPYLKKLAAIKYFVENNKATASPQSTELYSLLNMIIKSDLIVEEKKYLITAIHLLLVTPPQNKDNKTYKQVIDFLKNIPTTVQEIEIRFKRLTFGLLATTCLVFAITLFFPFNLPLTLGILMVGLLFTALSALEYHDNHKNLQTFKHTLPKLQRCIQHTFFHTPSNSASARSLTPPISLL